MPLSGVQVYLVWSLFFFKQKTAYEIKECDWSSDVCSSDLAMWDRVQACVELDVVIEVDRRRLPERELVRRGGQWLQGGTLEFLEQLLPRNGLAAKRAIVDQRDLLGNRSIQLGE